MREITTNTGI